MTTFTTIPNSSLEPGKPIRSIDGLALRDNPIAMFEGDASAPKLQTPAIQDDAVTKDKLQSPAAGGTYLISRLVINEKITAATYPGTDNLYIQALSLGVTVLVPGVIRCSLDHRAYGLVSVGARILKNGVQQAAWTTTSASFTTRTLDLTVDVGDLIIFQQNSPGEGFEAGWRNVFIYSNNPSMAVA